MHVVLSISVGILSISVVHDFLSISAAYGVLSISVVHVVVSITIVLVLCQFQLWKVLSIIMQYSMGVAATCTENAIKTITHPNRD